MPVFVQNLLVWAPTILFGLILLFQMLSGLRRGLRKSTILFINFWIALGLAVLVFFIFFKGDFDRNIVKILGTFNVNLQSILKTSQSYDVFSGYVKEFIEAQESFKQYTANLSSEEAMNVLRVFTEMGLRIAMFVVCLIIFFLLKFILYIFYLIFFKEGRRKRRIQAAYNNALEARLQPKNDGKVTVESSTNETKVTIKNKNDLKDRPREQVRNYKEVKPYKKRGGWGALIGLLRGFVVGTIFLSFVGSIFFVLTGPNYATKGQADKKIEIQGQDISPYYNIASRYGSVGIGNVLGWIKNSDQVPLYLYIASPVLSGGYVETNENGSSEYKPVTLIDDVAPITGNAVSLYATLSRYGVDLSKINDTEYLKTAILSSEVIDGKTLKEAVRDIVEDIKVTHFGDMLGTVALNMVIQKEIGDNITRNSSEWNELNIGQKILYDAFVGENSIKISTIVNGKNITSIFDVITTILENDDSLAKLQTVFKKEEQNTDEPTLVYGINPKINDLLLDETIEDATKFVDDIKDALISLTFFSNEKFGKLLTNILEDVITTMIPKFDLSLDSPDYLYNIDWNDTVGGLFDSIKTVIKVILNNEIETPIELIDYFCQDLGTEEGIGNQFISSLVDNSAVTVILNSKGFRKLLETTINDKLGNDESKITLLPASLGSYKDQQGKKVDGELKKLLIAFPETIKTVARLFISPDTENPDSEFYGLVDDELAKKQLDVLVREVLTPEGEVANYLSNSNFVRALISDIFVNIDFEKISEGNFNIIIPNTAFEEVTSGDVTKSIIKTDELLSAMNALSSVYSSLDVLSSGNVDDILDTLTDDMLTSISNSKILSSTLSKILCDTLKSAEIEIPELYDLTVSTSEEYLARWVGEGKEFDSFKDIIINAKELIKVATSKTTDNNELVETAVNLSNDGINAIASSVIVNTYLTKKMNELDLDGNKLLIPNVCYKDEELTMIAAEELNAAMRAISSIMGENFNLDSIKYNAILNEETASKIKASAILNSTIASIFVDKIASNENVEKYITIPAEYKADLNLENSSNIITNYNDSPWKDEIYNILKNISLVGLSISDTNEFAVNDAEIFTLGDQYGDTLKLNVVCESEILYLSISHILSTNDHIFVPSDLIENEKVKLEPLAQTFAMIKDIIGEDNLADPNFKLESVSDYFKLENVEFNTLISYMSNDIVNATVANTIITNVASSSESTVVVPNSYVFSKTDETNLSKWLKTNSNDGETVKMLKAIDDMGLIDKVANDTIEISATMFNDLTAAQIDEISSSAVMEATTILFINDNGTSGLHIPASYRGLTKATIEEDYETLDIVLDGEIRLFILAAKAVGSSIINPTLSAEIIEELNQTMDGKKKIEYVVDSKIMHFTLSTYIYDNSSYIDIPNAAKEKIDEENYVVKDELKNLVVSLNSLNVTDLETINADMILANNINMEEVLSSNIIWYTLSNKVNACAEIDKPTSVFEMVLGNSIITKEELNNLVSSFHALNLTQLDSVEVNQILGDELDIDDILLSKIMWYTLSNKITSVSTLVITQNIMVEDTENYVDKTEVKKLVSAVKKLTTTNDFNDVDVDI